MRWSFVLLFVILPIFMIGILFLLAKTSIFWFTLVIIWGIIEIVAVLVALIIVIFRNCFRVRNQYHEFENDKILGGFDEYPPANHVNQDLDIFRENSILKEELENEIELRANMNPSKKKRKSVKNVKSKGLKKKKTNTKRKSLKSAQGRKKNTNLNNKSVKSEKSGKSHPKTVRKKVGEEKIWK